MLGGFCCVKQLEMFAVIDVLFLRMKMHDFEIEEIEGGMELNR
jgi:hypothetical protein